jgi:hypothetical protein
MKTINQKIFQTFLLTAGIITGIIAFYSATQSKSVSDFTDFHHLYQPVNTLAEDLSTEVIYDNKESESGVKQPPLNIIASYILLNAKPDETVRKKPEKDQKASQRNLFIHFIQFIF